MALFQPSRLFISSDDKISGTHNDFTVELPDSIIGATAAMVSFACVPNLAYNFRKNQTTIYWKANYTLPIVGSASTTDPTTILKTTVTALGTSFTADLNDLMTKMNGAIMSRTYIQSHSNPALNGLQVNMTGLTGVLQFSIPDMSVAKLSFTSSVGIVFIGWNQPGTVYYNNLTYWTSYPIVNTPPAGQWWYNTLDYVNYNHPWAFPSLLRTQNVYILSDFSTGDNQGTSGRKDVLVKLPVDPTVQPGGMIQFEDSIGQYSITRLPRTIRRMTFHIVDDDYAPLEVPDEGPAAVSIEILLKYN